MKIGVFVPIGNNGWLISTHADAPRDKCGHSGAINHGHTCCYM